MSDNPTAVLEATEGFACEIDGELFIVGKGTTRVAASHPLAQHYPENFRPIEDGLSYAVETATATPGEVREVPVLKQPVEKPPEEPAKRPAPHHTPTKGK